MREAQNRREKLFPPRVLYQLPLLSKLSSAPAGKGAVVPFVEKGTEKSVSGRYVCHAFAVPLLLGPLRRHNWEMCMVVCSCVYIDMTTFAHTSIHIFLARFIFISTACLYVKNHEFILAMNRIISPHNS
uniref:Uncharacterized protein n=1 Tax=Pipistrellus kuhlii TaxID=59472 RepID=A0A7J7VBV7_PIPKU|nr:hypothetical protein mPipKuh1_008501 [Pipistrellus kuhlii]